MAVSTHDARFTEYRCHDLGLRNEIGNLEAVFAFRRSIACENCAQAVSHYRGRRFWSPSLENRVTYLATNELSLPLFIDTICPQQTEESCNEVRITPNVIALLRNLQHKSDEHHLWINAICLNQASIAEKQ